MTLFWRNYLTHFPEAAAAPGSLKISRVTMTDSSAGEESSCKAGDLGSIPRLGRSPGEGIGYPLQYSGLENSMDSQSWTGLSDFHNLTQHTHTRFWRAGTPGWSSSADNRAPC